MATTTSTYQQVTTEDVEDLLTSESRRPTLVRWLDTGDVEVTSGALLDDSTYGIREHDVIATKNDLSMANLWEGPSPTAEDYGAIAEMLNEG